MKLKKSKRSLIINAIRGDYDAIEILLHSHSDIILYTINQHSNAHDDAEDIKQEVSLKVFQNIKSLRAPEAFNAWLRTLIKNECCKHYSLRSGSDQADCIHMCEELLYETYTEFLPKEYTESVESQADLKRALGRLSPNLREIIELYYYREMRYREIAEHMGISTGSVSGYLSRIKSKLRYELEYMSSNVRYD